MSTVGQIERITQNRVVKRFQDHLGYADLDNWSDRATNRNIKLAYSLNGSSSRAPAIS